MYPIDAMEIINALQHHRAGRLPEATQIYQHILRATPDNADVLHLLANAALQLGNVDYAITLILRANALAPKNTTYLISLGMVYRAKKLYDLSLNCYARVLGIEPNSASAYFGIGNTLQLQGKLKDSAANFGKAIEFNPDFIEARYNLANLEKMFGNYSVALANYQIVVTAKPDFADAYHNMGSVLYALGKLDEALACYKHALWCNLPETHNNIGNIFFVKGQLNQSLDCYKQAIAAKPDYAEAYNNIGITLRKLGDFQESAAAFCQAITLMPDYSRAHLNFGDLLMECDCVNEAVCHYENAITLEPEMAEAYYNLGIARSKQDNLQSACLCFKHAIACRPDYVEAIYNLGVVSGRLARLAEAERCYREALHLEPSHVNSHINLSAILMEDGRTLEAKHHIDLAYTKTNIFEKHSPTANKTVLILFDAGRGNLNLSHLVNERTNNIIDWMIEYAAADQPANLPHYDLIFNAMGDPDVTGNTIDPVSRFLEVRTKPLLNHPDKVALTARNKLPNLLKGIDNLLIPAVWRFSNRNDWDDGIAEQLPLLTRPVHTQGGVGMVLSRTAEELEQCRVQQLGPVYVSHFIDYRSADSWFRKYRMIFIDRKPFPYHLAISQNWMVHYYTSEMESNLWKLKEEELFLQNPEAVIGTSAMLAIQAIGNKIDLDYAGIDFSIMQNGQVLVFEANPTMLVHPENKLGPLQHKNVFVQHIFESFEQLLERTINNQL